MKHKIIQKNDILLISAILLAACFLAVFFFAKEDSTEGAFLEITADGELYGRYPLNEDAVIDINGTNVCEISNGHVSMIEAAQYFPDIMEIILDPEFIRYSALEIILYVVGIIVALLYNPTSKRVGSKMARQDDVFITPLVANAGFGMDNAYGTSNTGYGTDNSAFGTNNTGYGTDNSAFGTNNQDFGTDNTGFGAGYDTSQHVR